MRKTWSHKLHGRSQSQTIDSLPLESLRISCGGPQHVLIRSRRFYLPPKRRPMIAVDLPLLVALYLALTQLITLHRLTLRLFLL